MVIFVDFAKEFLRPGSALVECALLLGLAAWAWMRPQARAFRWAALTVALGMYLMSVPLGANVLIWGLGHGLGQVQSAADARGADVVVLLGGGATSFRAGGHTVGLLTRPSLMRTLEAARVYRTIGHGTIIASGGAVRQGVDLTPEATLMRDILIGAGVPSRDVVEESASRNTREQAVIVGDMLKARGVTTFVLVTSPTHMRRSLAAFRAVGLDPVPSVSLVRSEHLDAPPLLLPTDDSLVESGEAIYDYAARVYYGLKGWTREPARR